MRQQCPVQPQLEACALGHYLVVEGLEWACAVVRVGDVVLLVLICMFHAQCVFFTQAPTFGIKDSRSILEQRQSLPIYKLKDQLVQAVIDNQVCVLLLLVVVVFEMRAWKHVCLLLI